MLKMTNNIKNQIRVWSFIICVLFVLTALYDFNLNPWFLTPSITGMFITSSAVRDTSLMTFHSFGVFVSILISFICFMLYLYLSSKLE